MIALSESNIRFSNWKTDRGSVWESVKKNVTNPIEREGVFKELARRLGVPVSVVKQDWLEYERENGGASSNDNGVGSAAADTLRRLRQYGVELWRSTEGEAFISLSVPNPLPDGEDESIEEEVRYHLEHFKIDSPEFKDWVAEFYNTQTGGILKEESISDVVRVLRAEARRGKTYELFTRVGWHGGRLYLDLATHDGKVVEVDENGFRTITSEESPVRFRRNRYQKALPEPKASRDGLFRILRLLGVKYRADHAKILAWAVGVLLRGGAYPILIIEGEKGAGKSTIAKFLKKLVDPTEVLLLFEPRNNEDLAISTMTNHVLVFDNLSKIPQLFSDSLSRVSTGAGIVKRQLYTDADIVVLKAKRPLVITGIAFGELRDDLVDRAIRLRLRRIEDAERLTDDELEEEFERLLPEALGHLLLAAARAIKDYERARERLKREGILPRMSTWAAWAEAAGPVLGLEKGEAVGAYHETQAAYGEEVLDENPVARAIRAFYDSLEAGTEAEYSTSELHSAVEQAAFPDSNQKKPSWWPDSPTKFGRVLPRLLGALQQGGVLIDSKDNTRNKTRRWIVTKPAPNSDKDPDKNDPKPGPREPATPPAPEASVLETAPKPDETPPVFDTEETTRRPEVITLLSAPPAPASKKRKEDPEKRSRRGNDNNEERGQKLYDGKSLYSEILRPDTSEEPFKQLGVKHEDVCSAGCAVIKPLDKNGGE